MFEGGIASDLVTAEFLVALEERHAAQARQEVEARKKAGLAVTPEWLEALERKYLALAWQEIAHNALSRQKDGGIPALNAEGNADG